MHSGFGLICLGDDIPDQWSSTDELLGRTKRQKNTLEQAKGFTLMEYILQNAKNNIISQMKTIFNFIFSPPESTSLHSLLVLTEKIAWIMKIFYLFHKVLYADSEGHSSVWNISLEILLLVGCKRMIFNNTLMVWASLLTVHLTGNGPTFHKIHAHSLRSHLFVIDFLHCRHWA